MRKFKYSTTFILLLLLAACCFFGGCKKDEGTPTNFKGLNFGYYYSEKSDGSYIKILNSSKAVLHNLDFTDLNPDDIWEEGEVSKEEVLLAMSGEVEYLFGEEEGKITAIWFEVKKGEQFGYLFGYGFVVNYNGFNELELNGTKYILQGVGNE